MEEVREKLPYSMGPRLFRACVEQLVNENTVVRDANLLRLPEHKIRLRDDEQSLVDRIRALLQTHALSPPDLKQIEMETRIGRARLGEIVRVMERTGSIVRVAPELYFLRERTDELKATLSRHLREKGTITPAGFRDLFGTSRKYTIPLLEYFDREGVTIRVGDARRLKHAPTALGSTGSTG